MARNKATMMTDYAERMAGTEERCQAAQQRNRELVEEIEIAFDRVGEAERGCLGGYRTLGELLKRAKESMAAFPGEWARWLAEHFKRTRQCCDNYIAIHEGWARLEAAIKDGLLAGDLSLRAALRHLRGEPDKEEDAAPQPPVSRSGLRLNKAEGERLAQVAAQAGLHDAEPAKLLAFLKLLDIPTAAIVRAVKDREKHRKQRLQSQSAA
jgi:hypothetical protein